MNRKKRFFAIIFIFVLMIVSISTVQAGGVVGNGTPGSCTEAAFTSALNGGGTVTFNCGPSPHTIILTSQKSINNDTTIEGGNLITLSGGNSTRLFDVGATLILRDIVLTSGYFNGDGGAIRNNANGTLALDNVTLQNSTATLSGGAIVSYGPLNILDSTLNGNSALNGGAPISVFPVPNRLSSTAISPTIRLLKINPMASEALSCSGMGLTQPFKIAISMIIQRPTEAGCTSLMTHLYYWRTAHYQETIAWLATGVAFIIKERLHKPG